MTLFFFLIHFGNVQGFKKVILTEDGSHLLLLDKCSVIRNMVDLNELSTAC